ncbi:ParB/RepB/Spo0J family partition protein [Streptomyces sp. NPDC006645]|uniref:ParB/RepB/Spo0J family partition protein n=1 Tax=unclassified Streptomyces TaxID=2593676 RepID=UPI0033ADAEDD
MVSLKYVTIPVGDIVDDRPIRKSYEDVKGLAVSVKGNGLRVPLMVNPADMSLISGSRRHVACRMARLVTVKVAFPSNIDEALEELGTHVTRPNNLHSVPMRPREKLDLALRLGNLPKSASRSIRSDHIIGPAVGLTGSILWRLRSVDHEASRRGPEQDSSARAASTMLGLMLEAVERPVHGWTAGQTVRLLHGIWKSGECADSLESVCTPPASPKIRVSGQALKPQTVLRPPPTPRPGHVEVRRGVDTISGACAGLASLDTTNIAPADITYLIREIKNNQQILRRILKNVQEADHDHFARQ